MHSELAFALRTLAKSRGFTAVAILTLAVGIGTTASMFSALRALVLEPFSYPQGDRLVHVWSNDGQPLSGPDFRDIKEQATSFTEFGVYSPRSVNLGGDNPESVRSVSTTAGVLRAFGIAPLMGRLIEPSDEVKDAPVVAVISHALWQRSFAGDPQIVGRTVRLNGGDATVVGVMPADFEFCSPWMRADTCQIWLPLHISTDSDRGSHWLCAVARLRDGVSVEGADAEIKAIGARLKAAYPNSNTHKPFLVRTLHKEMTRYVGDRVWMLFGAVALVLVVACANVASMLLARSAKRQSEFGVRIALGARRSSIVRLALAESLVLSLAGAVIGLGIAETGIRILRIISPVSEARKAAMTLDVGVVGVTIGIALFAALLAGLPPALAAARTSVTNILREGSRGCAGSRTRHLFLRTLVIAQVAVALMLTNGAALFSSSYMKMQTENAALATEYVLSAEISLQGQRYSKREDRTAFWERLDERVRTLPGISAAGATTKLPLEGGSNSSVLVKDEVFDPTAHRPLVEVSAITPGYFAAAGIALLRGRTHLPDDANSEMNGVVINRTLAETCWPGEDPLDKIIRGNGEKPWFTARVVGVVEDVRQWGPTEKPKPEMYFTPHRAWGQSFFLIVRSTQDAHHLAPMLRRELTSLDADLALARVRTLREVVDQAMLGHRVIAGMVNFFMATALALVAIGLHGTLSYHVLQRTREIGVRVALGALRRDISRLVVGQGIRWTLVGAGIGLAGAVAMSFGLRSLVYGLESVDPVSLLAATVVVAVATIIASLVPALRAARVDPMVALRGE